MKNIFKPILRLIYEKMFLPIASKAMRRMSRNIPKTDLGSKHLANAKLLENREELLKRIPENGVVAELGVDEGGFSNLILNISKPKKLHLIDFWGSKRYNQTKRNKVEQRFEKEINEGLVEINLGLSTEVADSFKENYFDWIYIDTAHSYDVTRDELELYRTKVKDNGIISGHDYILGNWNGMIRYGVIEAVHEFCLKYNWEIIYITTELTNMPSFAIRKIGAK
ncbi:class I SAM-dependent methyltransferase [Aquimarina sp. BL5]|uniref:class I SAM-dependent methyltransferase n=1 Tax=Aquimarina sp. BL5 TaxID=1714860 RepID=UPI000E518516|nr:class I SAM-dependent methyltransferase [Aquimarina sp. BL5]AXT51967.1 class I SAM-dependent methyltransferase [Aquimarina sp. BL5]RKM89831.1 class I SAM-dependent methyltransferase [Aquimarina sp. BL5]